MNDFSGKDNNITMDVNSSYIIGELKFSLQPKVMESHNESQVEKMDGIILDLNIFKDDGEIPFLISLDSLPII